MTNIQVYEETLTFVSTFPHSHTHHISGWLGLWVFSSWCSTSSALQITSGYHLCSTPSTSSSSPLLAVLIYWHLRQNLEDVSVTPIPPENPVHQDTKTRLCLAGIWSNFPFNSDPDIFLWPSEEPYFCPMICQETPQDSVLLQALTHLSNIARHKLWCQAPWHSITTCPSIHTSFGIFFSYTALSKPMWKSPHQNRFTDLGSSSF